jgi:integration host factor subunit beta
MKESLLANERVEIRGFGRFSLHFRPPRMGRNPKTGEPVPLAGKHVPHFKPGKELRERVNGEECELGVEDDDDDDEDDQTPSRVSRPSLHGAGDTP